MSGEWAATETGRTMARLAPSAFAISAAASIAARSPETTTWPGELRFATAKMPCADAWRDELRDRRVVESEDRGHRAVAARAAGLHLAAALADEADAIGERQDVGRDHRRVLAHRVAGDEAPVRQRLAGGRGRARGAAAR